MKGKKPLKAVYLFYFLPCDGRGFSFSLHFLCFFCLFFGLRCRRRLWGRIRNLPVYGVPLLPQRQFWAKEKAEQKKYLIEQLLDAKRLGGVVVGMPMVCREILPETVPIPVADGRPMAMVALLEEAEAALRGFQGKDIILTHADGMWAAGAADYLSSAGAWVFLQGRQAAVIAAQLYRKKGVALPVLSPSKGYTIALTPGEDVPGQSCHLKESLTAVPGIWYSRCPFTRGFLPAGLAAALWQVVEEI